jgi:hypothetical protein
MQNLNQDSQCPGQDLRRALNRSLQHYVRTELLGGHGGEVLKLLGFPCST